MNAADIACSNALNLELDAIDRYGLIVPNHREVYQMEFKFIVGSFLLVDSFNIDFDVSQTVNSQ